MNKLEQGKTISDRLSKGENVSEKEIEKLVNSMNEQDLLDLFNYAIKKEV